MIQCIVKSISQAETNGQEKSENLSNFMEFPVN